MTNYDAAVKQLKTARNVEQWNEIRARVKGTLTRPELAKIDSGLIVQVLGKD